MLNKRAAYGGIVLGSFVLARLWLVSLALPTPFPDTPAYAAQAAAGPLSRSMWVGYRPPLTGLMMWAFPTDRLYVTVQAVLGGLAWAFLALTLARSVSSHAAKVVVVGGLFLLGGTVLGQWDAMLLSDSVALSLCAVAVAVTLRYAARPSRRWLAAIVATAVLLVMSRDLNATILVAVACGAVLVGWRRALPAASGVFAVAVVALLVQAASPRPQVMLADELRWRVLPSSAVSAFYRAHGMPASDPGPWMQRHGEAVKALWTVERPATTVLRPFSTPNAATSRFGAYTPYRWPRALVTFDHLARPTGAAAGAELAVVVAGVLLLWRRRRFLAATVTALVGVAAVTVVLSWVGEAIEAPRHGLNADLLFRVAFLLTVAAGVDELRRSEPDRAYGPPADRDAEIDVQVPVSR